MRAFFTTEMKDIELPKKVKISKKSSIEKHREQIEEYITILMMLGKIGEQNGVQEWFKLDKLKEYIDKDKDVMYFSGMQCMDEIEANTNKELHNAVAQQMMKVTKLSDDLSKVDSKIKRRSTSKLLDERMNMVEVQDKEEILLAALKHNLNLWEGQIELTNLPPIDGSELYCITNETIEKNEMKPKVSKPQKSSKPKIIPQFSLKQSKPEFDETVAIKQEAKKVLTLAQMIREQKSYISFKSQLEAMETKEE